MLSGQGKFLLVEIVKMMVTKSEHWELESLGLYVLVFGEKLVVIGCLV